MWQMAIDSDFLRGNNGVFYDILRGNNGVFSDIFRVNIAIFPQQNVAYFCKYAYTWPTHIILSMKKLSPLS